MHCYLRYLDGIHKVTLHLCNYNAVVCSDSKLWRHNFIYILCSIVFFNLIHYTIFRPEIVKFIPIYRYFVIYDVTKKRYIGTLGLKGLHRLMLYFFIRTYSSLLNFPANACMYLLLRLHHSIRDFKLNIRLKSVSIHSIDYKWLLDYSANDIQARTNYYSSCFLLISPSIIKRFSRKFAQYFKSWIPLNVVNRNYDVPL